MTAPAHASAAGGCAIDAPSRRCGRPARPRRPLRRPHREPAGAATSIYYCEPETGRCSCGAAHWLLSAHRGGPCPRGAGRSRPTPRSRRLHDHDDTGYAPAYAQEEILITLRALAGLVAAGARRTAASDDEAAFARERARLAFWRDFRCTTRGGSCPPWSATPTTPRVARSPSSSSGWSTWRMRRPSAHGCDPATCIASRSLARLARHTRLASPTRPRGGGAWRLTEKGYAMTIIAWSGRSRSRDPDARHHAAPASASTVAATLARVVGLAPAPLRILARYGSLGALRRVDAATLHRARPHGPASAASPRRAGPGDRLLLEPRQERPQVTSPRDAAACCCRRWACWSTSRCASCCWIPSTT